MLLRRSRGQTMIETVIMLPLVLLAIFCMIYLAKYAVVSERAELSLRYGLLTGFDTGAGAYSAGNIYQNINLAGLPAPCATAPPQIFSNSAPFPGPTSAPFWQPDVAPTSTCTTTAIGLGGAQFLAAHYIATTLVTVAAGVNVPTYLVPMLGSGAQTVHSSASFTHSAYPGLIMYCSNEVYNRVWGAITAGGTTATPPPNLGNRNGCPQ